MVSCVCAHVAGRFTDVRQSFYRGYVARQEARALVSAVYRKMYDVHSGFLYYFNTLTGESSWHKPLAIAMRDVDLDMTPRTQALMLQAYAPLGTLTLRRGFILG